MKGLIHITLVAFLLLSSGKIFAQQIAQYSQWSSHQFALNPAHAGIKSCIDVHTLYRTQWVGFGGAPRSGMFTLSAPLNAKRKQYFSARQGIGMRFESDRIGQFNTNRLNAAYAAHFNFTRDTRLSLGLYGGVIQLGYDPSSSTTIDPDPTVLKEASFVVPDASFGAWWNGQNYYAGLVLDHLIASRWKNIGTSSKFHFHALLNAGYRFQFTDKFTLIPAVLIKIPSRGPVALDLQMMADLNNQFNFGLGFRNQDCLVFFAGFKINQRLSIQYSFDATVSALRKASSNTHEISLSYNSCRKERSSTSACPLFE
ncbi:MAG: PorP/SprF family type IX secretion system membrane protein [Flavobacteriia bacterium]|jgi:type IX secretion system PorP/SprF family membrane protein|nr:PorP/SprF family type IX secretion system membrane protein [Cryomorphaceae bacterium]